VPTTVPTAHSPVAQDDRSGNVNVERVRIDVLANDSDPDGNLDKDSLKILRVAGDYYMSVQVSSNEIDVRLEELKTVTVKVWYRVCDTTRLCSRATLTVTFVLWPAESVTPVGLHPTVRYR
jgi:hypothetical protein